MDEATNPVHFVTDLLGERVRLPGGATGTVRAFGYQQRTLVLTIETDSGHLRTHRGEAGVKVVRAEDPR